MRFITTLLLIVLFSCSEQEFPDASLTVEAYLFEGKPVNQIKLSLVKPLNTDEIEPPVSNAEVYINWNGRYYQLIESTINPGVFESQNSDLQIISNNTYLLYIRYNDEEYYAQTTVPNPPINLVASKDTLNFINDTDLIKMQWNNSDSSWFLGVISPEKNKLKEFPFNNFFSLPTRANELEININHVQENGTQQFILYGITRDYEKLFRISNSSIGSSNAGNISQGFGIFASFSSDTLNFVVLNK